ncbi:MAG TPA: hypothetical protein VEH05_06345 [Streptosporangiaceae bacterium]|nr:hypothetical protein [Streptosporangiaceae bacterium]
MRRSARWWWLLLPVLLAGVTACGTLAAPQQAAGQSGSVSVSLTTVRMIRSVTISPGHARFVDCKGGDGMAYTASKGNKLGFPNGTCLVSSAIVITNTGIASDIDISGSDAEPADGSTGWTLCNTGPSPAASCTGHKHRPGPDQYKVINYDVFGSQRGGITDTPRCDRVFGPEGSCWARHLAVATEGLWLIGPEWSSDTSTQWTVTITWTPMPGPEN